MIAVVSFRFFYFECGWLKKAVNLYEGHPEKLRGVPYETKKEGPVLSTWEGAAVEQMMTG